MIHQEQRIVSMVLTNLLHNAIKYPPEDTEIGIKVELLKGKIIFHIIDRGIGIPEKGQKHVFEKYYRADNVLLIQGTGIGLNIVKVHLENRGGSSYFKSKAVKGSVFSVEFPSVEGTGDER